MSVINISITINKRVKKEKTKKTKRVFSWSASHIRKSDNSPSIVYTSDDYRQYKSDVVLILPQIILNKLSSVNKEEESIKSVLILLLSCISSILIHLEGRNSKNTYILSLLREIIKLINIDKIEKINYQQLEDLVEILLNANSISPEIAIKMGWKIYPIVNNYYRYMIKSYIEDLEKYDVHYFFKIGKRI
jgi:hypothetical protein